MWNFLSNTASSIAQMYGYKKLTPLIQDNIGLLAVLIAFTVGAFLLFRVSRTIPAQGKAPLRLAAYQLIIKFVIGAFAVVVLFAVFAEGKKIASHTKTSSNEKRVPVYSATQSGGSNR